MLCVVCVVVCVVCAVGVVCVHVVLCVVRDVSACACGGACGVVCGEAWHAGKSPVCRFNTPPCVRSGRPERTHGGVLNLHTGGLCLVSFSLSLSLFLLSLPSLLSTQKKREGLFFTGIILYYRIIIIQKNQRRVKLQSLQFYIYSKTINLHHVKSVIISAEMVTRNCHAT